MVASALSGLLTGLLSLFGLLLGLLPTIDVSALPVAIPAPIAQSLAALNWFVPVGTLLSVLTLWIALLLAFNAFLLVAHVLQAVTRG